MWFFGKRLRKPRRFPLSPSTQTLTNVPQQEGNLVDRGFLVRALQLGERIDLRGLEREDAFSTSPLGFRTASCGTVVLFKFGAAVFFGLTPVEEEGLISSLGPRIGKPLADRESEAARITVRPDAEDMVSLSGAIQLQRADPNRLLLVAQAMAVSVSLAYDERRIAGAFERIEPVAKRLAKGQLPAGPIADRLDLRPGPTRIYRGVQSSTCWIVTTGACALAHSRSSPIDQDCAL
jgi:uncharacterized Rmd1/YagE family protein